MRWNSVEDEPLVALLRQYEAITGTVYEGGRHREIFGMRNELKPEVEKWLLDNEIDFEFEEDDGFGDSYMEIEDDRQAILFKLAWL